MENARRERRGGGRKGPPFSTTSGETGYAKSNQLNIMSLLEVFVGGFKKEEEVHRGGRGRREEGSRSAGVCLVRVRL